MPKDWVIKAAAKAAKHTGRLPKGDVALHKATGANIARDADGNVIVFGPYETEQEDN